MAALHLLVLLVACSSAIELLPAEADGGPPSVAVHVPGARAYTVEMWARLATAGPCQLAAARQGTADNGFDLGVTDTPLDGLRLGLCSAGREVCGFSRSLWFDDREWHHYAVAVGAGGEASLFFDGFMAAAVVAPPGGEPRPSSDSVAEVMAGGAGFAGEVLGLAAWRGAWTSADARAAAAAGRGATHARLPSGAVLAGRWPLDAGLAAEPGSESAAVEAIPVGQPSQKLGPRK
jgi:hypothetical protein